MLWGISSKMKVPRKAAVELILPFGVENGFLNRSGYLQSTVDSQKTLKWLFTVNCQ